MRLLPKLPALPRSWASRSSCRWVMGCRVIFTPPISITSSGCKAQMDLRLPLMNSPPEDSVSRMVQLPSSYRVRTQWFRDMVGTSSTTSQLLLLPMTFSQWVMGSLVPSAMVSQAQISGARRKNSRGFTARNKIKNARAGAT